MKDRQDEQPWAFQYRTPVRMMLDAEIASAINGSFGASTVVGR